MHNQSLAHLLAAAFPEHTWDAAEFKIKRRAFLSSLAHQRAELERVRERLGIGADEWERWYSVSQRELVKHGASALLHLHDNSIAHLLRAVYPEHPWQLWRFPRFRSRRANRALVAQSLVAHAATQLGVTRAEEWREVTPQRLRAVGLEKAFAALGGVDAALALAEGARQDADKNADAAES